MNIQLLAIFVSLSVVNVILQTVKSIATVKCGKGVASLLNAIAFGLYTVVTVYTMCDLPLMVKAFIVAFCNLVGVFIVKWVEEKSRKDKLWKVELTSKKYQEENICNFLDSVNLPYSMIYDESGKYTIFNVYCATQKESLSVKELVKAFNVKYFVSECKAL